MKQKTKQGVYWTFLNQGATLFMQFVVGIVMARLLTPEDFGITALPNIFMAIAHLFLDSGFSQALIRKQNVTEKDLATSFYYSIMVGVVLYVILFLTAPLIAAFYRTPVLTTLVRITALGFLWGPINTPQIIILNRRLDFKTTACISMFTNIVGAIIGIAAAYSGYGFWALVISTLVSSVLRLILLWYVVKWIPKERFSKSSFKYLWNYGNKLLCANLIDVIYNNVASFVIGKLYSATLLGVYFRAETYAKLPAQQLTGLLNGVSFPVLSKMQSDTENLGRNYRRMIKTSAFISFPLFFLLCALSRPLILLMLTDKWESCVLLLQIMCLAKMWWPIMSLNRAALQVQGRTDVYLKMEAKKRFVNFILMCVSLKFGIVVFCCYQIVETIIAMCFNTYYTGKLLGVGLLRQILDVLPFYGLSVFMFMVVISFNSVMDSYWAKMIIGFFIGVLVYGFGAFIFKFKEIEDIKYMINLKK